MVGYCLGAVLEGITGQMVRVEADVSNGIPQFSIVGLPDSAVQESKLRIKAAVRNAGFEFPGRRITVNLSPASVRKRGAGLDLPIAIAILRASGQLPDRATEPIGFAAELSLSGDLVPIPGTVVLALALRERDVRRMAVAAAQEEQCIPVPDVSWLTFDTLADVSRYLRHGIQQPRRQQPPSAPSSTDTTGDFLEVTGLTEVKRALTIAAIGRHHTLLVGPPGSGKTWIAERFAGILPELTEVQALEVFAIHQTCTGNPRHNLRPPLRMPHHSLSPAGMVGGGNRPLPGEATLAHHGVLMLDEVLEFSRSTLDALREPLVQKSVQLSRSGHRAVFPADFVLIGTLNPCPCGYSGFGDCTCLGPAITRYWNRLSGALLDRMDMQVPVHKPAWATQSQQREPSAHIRRRVSAARVILNSEPKNRQATTAGSKPDDFQDEAWAPLFRAASTLSLSTRAMASIQRVARSAAALDGLDVIAPCHVAEALALRTPSEIQTST